MTKLAALTVMGHLNFAADRKTDGVWCNHDRSLITQELRACAVALNDATGLPGGPKLEREGFTRTQAPIGQPPSWNDADWVREHYIPHCMNLVQALTGAERVLPFKPRILMRETGNTAAAPPAEFVHLDINLDRSFAYLEGILGAADAAKVRRFRIFNIWRAITPPPQDVPLAICDQRTIERSDWVYGRTVTPENPAGEPYITSLFNPAQKWFYFPEVEADQAIVFKGLDSDDDAPFGCMHGAFRLPQIAPGLVPRASVEARVFALDY